VSAVALRILVVEDNDDNVALIEYLLRAHGFEPLLARSGADGLALTIEQRPDVVLLDIRMDGMDGYAVAAEIRRRPELSAIRLVAVTASVTASDVQRVAAAGFDGFIAKPIEPTTFVAQVRSFLPGEATGTLEDAGDP
jgi:CheY-like chemotaxis protein